MACFGFLFSCLGAKQPPLVFDFKDKYVIVTGASEGLGVAIVERLASEGVAGLALAARRKGKLEEVAVGVKQRYPSLRVLTVETDVSKAADCARLVEETLRDFGRCDVLVNNAAIPGVMHYESAALERFDEVIDINLKGSMYVARCVLPAMIKAGAGHIVNIASMAGKDVEPYNCVYAASKYGMVGWSHSLRAEMLVERIPVKVNLVVPGFISDVGMAAGPSHALKIDATLADAIADRGCSSPADVASAVVRAVQYDEPEVMVNSKYRAAQFARDIGLAQRFPRRRDRVVLSPAFSAVLRWLKSVADGQDQLRTCSA